MFMQKQLAWKKEWTFEPMIGGYGLEKLNIETEEEVINGKS